MWLGIYKVINNILLLTYIGFTFDRDRKIKMDDWRRRYFIFISWFQIIYSILSTFWLTMALISIDPRDDENEFFFLMKKIFPKETYLQEYMESICAEAQTPPTFTVIFLSMFGLFLDLIIPIVILSYVGKTFGTPTEYLEADESRRRFLIVASYILIIYQIFVYYCYYLEERTKPNWRWENAFTW